ncbi:hypothetical protein BD779DRAFT_1493705 [Infundibulicybe gibba]|nr:hypothetical protein BD779DRAFT_1493705 [Infundibulicybe gibba]
MLCARCSLLLILPCAVRRQALSRTALVTVSLRPVTLGRCFGGAAIRQPTRGQLPHPRINFVFHSAMQRTSRATPHFRGRLTPDTPTPIVELTSPKLTWHADAGHVSRLTLPAGGRRNH